MIQIRRNNHHMNGESQPVLEVWRSDPTTDNKAQLELVVAIPIEHEEEEVTVIL